MVTLSDMKEAYARGEIDESFESKKIFFEKHKDDAEYYKWKGTIERNPGEYSKVSYLRGNRVPERIWGRLAEELEVINDAMEEEFGKEDNNKKAFMVFEKERQAIEFIKKQPIFFDKSGMWWLWNFKDTKFEMTDKTQILTDLKNTIGANVINSKERTEIINALEVVGRENIPENLSKQCIQFKNKIINIKTGDEFISSPKYFSTNPIPWKIGDSEDTPMMDEYFREWVGEEYINTLYEIIAYSSCSDQFMQRMIALVGGGSNGKGTFIKLLKKFVGKDNCTSSELQVLSDNTFETSALYKKLVCEMGEVSHDDLKNTNQIKKLSGQDDIRYCFKGKTAFTDESSTTCLINTNSLPVSKDKTAGFYRRWLIIDFPNQFKIKEGLIEAIPDIEFENLAKKSIRILNGMYQTYKFTNEGDIDERAKRYEERSNPVMRYVEEYCIEDFEQYISLKKFSREFNEYLKINHLRSQTPKEIKKTLTEEGFDIRKTTRFDVCDVYIIGLNIKQELMPLMPLMPKNETSTLHGNLTTEKGINGINGIFSKEFDEDLEKAGITRDYLSLNNENKDLNKIKTTD